MGHHRPPQTPSSPPPASSLAGAQPGPPGVAPAKLDGRSERPPASTNARPDEQATEHASTSSDEARARPPRRPTLDDVRAFVTGPKSGRRYTPQQRFCALEVFHASGMTQRAFAAATGISMSSLTAWRHGTSVTRVRVRKQGRHFTPEERRRTVEAFFTAGLSQDDFARIWGVKVHTLRSWLGRYREGGPKALENKLPARGDKRLERRIEPATIQKIEETKRRFPDFGLRRVRDFVARFSGSRVSLGSVKRTLDDAGIEPLPPPRPRRRQKKKPPRRFERAKPGQLWQSDITSFHLPRDSRRVYLVAFVDDHSRFIVSWALACHQKSTLVIEAVTDGLGRFGRPDEILTDQGRQYFAWRGKSGFTKLLEREGIEHIVSRAQHPQTLGKCERLWQTVEREFWQRAQPRDLGDARARFAHWVSHYNFFRPHQGIDGLVPADRFFGAEDTVRAAIEARLSADELAAAIEAPKRERLYLFGQLGDERIALSGEEGRLVVHLPDGGKRELSLDELGAGEAAASRASFEPLPELPGDAEPPVAAPPSDLSPSTHELQTNDHESLQDTDSDEHDASTNTRERPRISGFGAGLDERCAGRDDHRAGDRDDGGPAEQPPGAFGAGL